MIGWLGGYVPLQPITSWLKKVFCFKGFDWVEKATGMAVIYRRVMVAAGSHVVWSLAGATLAVVWLPGCGWMTVPARAGLKAATRCSRANNRRAQNADVTWPPWGLLNIGTAIWNETTKTWPGEYRFELILSNLPILIFFSICFLEKLSSLHGSSLYHALKMCDQWVHLDPSPGLLTNYSFDLWVSVGKISSAHVRN